MASELFQPGGDGISPFSGLDEGDRETLSELIREGMGENSLRATRSDLNYIATWHHACFSAPLSWPPARSVVLSFIAHHLWSPDIRAGRQEHGMPEHVRLQLTTLGVLRVDGPHKPATVRRRLSSWAALCRLRGVTGPFADPVVRKTLATATRASKATRERKSAKAVDAEMIRRLFEHLRAEDRQAITSRDRRRLTAVRDQAMIAVCYASGGRRRSEIARMTTGDLEELDPIEEEGRSLPSMRIRLGRTKTTDAEEDSSVFITGAPVRFLKRWLSLAGISDGPVFRSIDRWGNISRTRPGDEALNDILKKRIAEIGEDPALYSAHGIRSGYITDAFREGISAIEIMEQTRHRSLSTTMSYYNDARRRTGRAARLLSDTG